VPAIWRSRFIDRRPARPIGILDTTDHKFAFSLDTLFLEHGKRHVRGRQREGGGHHTALGTGPHEAGIPSGAQGQSQRVEQDGLPRARLAGEDGEATVEREIKLLDENDVADGKRGEHKRLIPEIRRGARGGVDYSGLIARKVLLIQLSLFSTGASPSLETSW
jgi:hypothetical protein